VGVHIVGVAELKTTQTVHAAVRPTWRSYRAGHAALLLLLYKEGASLAAGVEA